MPRRGWSPPREIEPKALVPVPWCGSYEVADSRRKSSATLQARTQHGEVTDEGDCGDGSGFGNGRDEVNHHRSALSVSLVSVRIQDERGDLTDTEPGTDQTSAANDHDRLGQRQTRSR